MCQSRFSGYGNVRLRYALTSIEEVNMSGYHVRECFKHAPQFLLKKPDLKKEKKSDKI